jgi:putative membrane protein
VFGPYALKGLSRILRSVPAQFLTHPVTALVQNIGGMWLLCAMALCAAALESSALHAAVHLHFLAAGYLFCWPILAGPDPAPNPRRDCRCGSVCFYLR